MRAPCVVRSLVDWDTQAPRDMRKDELGYLYWVETDGGHGDYWLHLISLERSKRFTLMMRKGMKAERWFEVVA